MEDAAASVAALPSRNIADLAAKLVFFVEIMNYQEVWYSLTDAEGDVLASVEGDALALVAAAA